MVSYIQSAELPDIQITWRDSDGDIIDYSTGWTFIVRIGMLGQSAVLEKTTGVVGNNTAPNIVITWSSTELNTLATGTYVLQVVARETASGKDRVMADSITITPQVLAP
jgi:hypothetical protein